MLGRGVTFFAWGLIAFSSSAYAILDKTSTQIMRECMTATSFPYERTIAGTYLAVTGLAIKCQDLNDLKEYVDNALKDQSDKDLLTFEIARKILESKDGKRYLALSDMDYVKRVILNLSGKLVDNERAQFYIDMASHESDPTKRKAYMTSAIVYDYINELRGFTKSKLFDARVSTSLCFAKNAFYSPDEVEGDPALSFSEAAAIAQAQSNVVSFTDASDASVADIIKTHVIANRKAWPCDAQVDTAYLQCDKPLKKYTTYKCRKEVNISCRSTGTVCDPTLKVTFNGGWGGVWNFSSSSGETRFSLGDSPGSSDVHGSPSKVFTGSYTISIASLETIDAAKIVGGHHDDSMEIAINGQPAYDSYKGLNEHDMWQGNVEIPRDIDIKPLLKQGDNIVDVRLAVGKHGEGWANFYIKGKCLERCSASYNYSEPSCEGKGEQICNVAGAGDVGVSYEQVIPDPPGNVALVDASQGIYEFDFGAWPNANYWATSVHDDSYKFTISDTASVALFKLVRAKFDDWIGVWVNGSLVWVGPYGGQSADRLDLVSGDQVCYTASNCGPRELSTLWEFPLDIDLTPYLVNGENTIRLKTIVYGGGSGAVKIRGQFIGNGCTY